EQARQAGIEACLTKPIHHAQLFSAITTVMGLTLPQDDALPLSPFLAPLEIEGPPRNRPLLLVVEDNAINQKLAARLLEKIGYRADVVANGFEALEALVRIPY